MVLTITEVIVECAGVSMDLHVPVLIIDLRGVSIMSALFANRWVTHLRVVGHHLGAHMFQTKGLQSAGNVSIETGIVSGEIAESGSACDIEILQGVLCECLLIKVINKILNKINKRVLLIESCIRFGGNLMHVSRL